MQYWQVFILILKNLKHVIQFVQMIEGHIKDGLDERDLQIGLERMEKGFINVKTIRESAIAAGYINDSLRR